MVTTPCTTRQWRSTHPTNSWRLRAASATNNLAICAMAWVDSAQEGCNSVCEDCWQPATLAPRHTHIVTFVEMS